MTASLFIESKHESCRKKGKSLLFRIQKAHQEILFERTGGHISCGERPLEAPGGVYNGRWNVVHPVYDQLPHNNRNLGIIYDSNFKPLEVAVSLQRV